MDEIFDPITNIILTSYIMINESAQIILNDLINDR